MIKTTFDLATGDRGHCGWDYHRRRVWDSSRPVWFGGQRTQTHCLWSPAAKLSPHNATHRPVCLSAENYAQFSVQSAASQLVTPAGWPLVLVNVVVWHRLHDFLLEHPNHAGDLSADCCHALSVFYLFQLPTPLNCVLFRVHLMDCMKIPDPQWPQYKTSGQWTVKCSIVNYQVFSAENVHQDPHLSYTHTVSQVTHCNLIPCKPFITQITKVCHSGLNTAHCELLCLPGDSLYVSCRLCDKHLCLLPAKPTGNNVRSTINIRYSSSTWPSLKQSKYLLCILA